MCYVWSVATGTLPAVPDSVTCVPQLPQQLAEPGRPSSILAVGAELARTVGAALTQLQGTGMSSGSLWAANPHKWWPHLSCLPADEQAEHRSQASNIEGSCTFCSRQSGESQLHQCPHQTRAAGTLRALLPWCAHQLYQLSHLASGWRTRLSSHPAPPPAPPSCQLEATACARPRAPTPCCASGRFSRAEQGPDGCDPATGAPLSRQLYTMQRQQRQQHRTHLCHKAEHECKGMQPCSPTYACMSFMPMSTRAWMGSRRQGSSSWLWAGGRGA